MKNDRRSAAVRDLQMLFSAGALGRLSDGELLERFAAREGEVAELAFAVLIERHGPMVLRTCLQALGDLHEAEDALQATFLVLARRARSFRVRGSLAPWLHEVARRTASRLRTSAARRRRHECKAAALAGSAVCDRLHDDLGRALHDELGRLPPRYRVPLVLCYLEGLTAEQAARELGWPAGTVRSRLARGRERLRARLIRRGLTPAIGGLAGVLLSRPAAAAVSAEVVATTARAATLAAAGRLLAGAVPASILNLTEGVLFNMALTNLKATGLALLVGGAVCGGAIVLAQEGPGRDNRNRPADRSESDRLQAMEATLDRIVQLLEGRSAPHYQGHPPGPDMTKSGYGVTTPRDAAQGAFKAAPGGPPFPHRQPAAGKEAPTLPDLPQDPGIMARVPKQPEFLARPGPYAAATPFGQGHGGAPDVAFGLESGGQGGSAGSTALEQRVVELERRMHDLERQLADMRDGRWGRPSQPAPNRLRDEQKK
jgi:RNA polymerase sigma factor (sigma-70 family)